jgi:K+-transporting ATPase KdpF subunit
MLWLVMPGIGVATFALWWAAPERDRSAQWRCRMNYAVVLTAVLAFIYLTYVILRPDRF